MLLCFLRVDYDLLLCNLRLCRSRLRIRFAVEGSPYRDITTVSWLSVRRVEFFSFRTYISSLGLRLLNLYYLLRHTA